MRKSLIAAALTLVLAAGWPLTSVAQEDASTDVATTQTADADDDSGKLGLLGLLGLVGLLGLKRRDREQDRDTVGRTRAETR